MSIKIGIEHRLYTQKHMHVFHFNCQINSDMLEIASKNKILLIMFT